MINKNILVITSALLCSSSLTTLAADKTIETPSGYTWDGVYFGIGGGFGAVVHEVDVPPLGGFNFNGIGGEGVFGELTIGYDYSITDRILFGIYGNYRFGDIKTELNIPGLAFNADISLDSGYDIIGRLGYVLTPSTLGYVLGGYSHQNFELSTNVGLGFDFDQSGYVIGTGLETVLKDNWTLKSEYRYAQYGDEDFGSGGLLSIEPSTHTFHSSLVYRMNGGIPAETSISQVAYDFTGWRAGLSFGAGAVVHQVNVNLGGNNEFNGIGGEGVFAEASLGYDWGLGDNFVVGLGADVRFGSIETDLNIPALGGFSADIDADLGFDFTGRLGYLLEDNALVYGLAGYSYQEFDVGLSALGGIPDLDFELGGWTVGAGLEVGVSENLSTKLEYRYAEYEDEDFGTGGLLTVEPSIHTVRLGINYRLN